MITNTATSTYIIEMKDSHGRWHGTGQKYTRAQAQAMTRYHRLYTVGKMTGVIPGGGVCEDVRCKEAE